MQQSLRKELSFIDLVVNGLIFIGPASAIGIFGVLYAKSNGAVAGVYILATLVMSLTACSYAQMAQAIPKSGSVYAYASLAFGSKIGFLSGWMLLLDYLLIPAVAYLFSGIAFNAMFTAIPTWIFTLLVVIVTLGLNLRGIRNVALVNKVVLFIVVIALAALLIIGSFLLYHDTVPGKQAFIGMPRANLSQLIACVSIAVLSFLGFDAIATFAEEYRGKRQQIGWAMILCLVIAGILFVWQSYIGSLLAVHSPEYYRSYPQYQGKAYYETINAKMPALLFYMLTMMKALGAACAAMVATAASSRLVFGIGRDGLLNKRLGQATNGSGTPVYALLSSSVITLSIAVAAALRKDGLETLVSLVNIGALTAFFMVHLSVVKYYWLQSKSGSIVKHLIVPLIGGISILYVMVLSAGMAQLIGVIWLVLGYGWYIFNGYRTKNAN